ncbi:hypothetical protein [Pseudomonas sp. 22 E 5]|nr:hypothetical protein [Pseudomonas sp. 22 E 5]
MVILQPALDEMDVFGDVVFPASLVGQEGFHHVLGHARPHQPGQVGFNAVAQTAQGVGAPLIEWQIQITQRLFNFLLRRLGAQGLGQLRGELLGRGRMQFAALRTAHVIHRAGFGGAGFFRAGVGEQGDQGEHQDVGGQGGNRSHVPTGVIQHVDHVQQRDVETLQITDQRQQHSHDPHQDSGQQTGDETTAIGGRPVQYRQHAWEELQGGDKRNDAQVGQVLPRAQQQVEPVAGHDDRDDQRAACPFQPAVDIAFGWRLVQRQHQVVERHS